MTDREHDRHREHDEHLDRENDDREVDLDAERTVELDDAVDEALPPPTIDPEERIEAEPDPDIALDDERPAG